MKNGKWKMENVKWKTWLPGFVSFSIFHFSFSICHLSSVAHEACLGFGDHPVDRLHFGDKLREHVRQQRLRPIRQSLLRVIVNFDHYAVRSGGAVTLALGIAK